MQDLQTQIITKYLDVILCTSYQRDDPRSSLQQLLKSWSLQYILTAPCNNQLLPNSKTAHFCKMNLDKQHETKFVKMLIFTVLSNSFNFLHCNEGEPFLCELKQDSENSFSGDRYIWLTGKFAVNNWSDNEFLNQGGRLALTQWKKGMQRRNVFFFSLSLRIPEISKGPARAPEPLEGKPCSSAFLPNPSILASFLPVGFTGGTGGGDWWFIAPENPHK